MRSVDSSRSLSNRWHVSLAPGSASWFSAPNEATVNTTYRNWISLGCKSARKVVSDNLRLPGFPYWPVSGSQIVREMIKMVASERQQTATRTSLKKPALHNDSPRMLCNLIPFLQKTNICINFVERKPHLLSQECEMTYIVLNVIYLFKATGVCTFVIEARVFDLDWFDNYYYRLEEHLSILLHNNYNDKPLIVETIRICFAWNTHLRIDWACGFYRKLLSMKSKFT